ncbi:MAG: exodeoxyribonuclease VII small subunit [Synergistales bacterium]|nr:exodeoxyribonuclease VII small subunit [Synergistales bacterium]
MTFSQDFNTLETIVGQLEEDTMELERSLELFEEGVRLYRRCSHALQQSEQRVAMLLENEDGEPAELPWEGAERDGENGDA